MLSDAEGKVKNDPKYGKELILINSFFNKHPKNIDLNIVAAKIALIDTTNSTHLSRYKSKLSLYDVSEIIIGIKDIDKRLKQGDIGLVEEIAKKTKIKYGINLFSFATKYCFYHNVYVYKKDDYSIFDNVVKDHLKDYNTQTRSVSAYKVDKWRKSINYKEFNKYIGDLLSDYKITLSNRRRAFDHFVWYNNKGKNTIFPKNKKYPLSDC